MNLSDDEKKIAELLGALLGEDVPQITSEIAFGDPIFLGDPWTCWKTETQWKTDAMCRN